MFFAGTILCIKKSRTFAPENFYLMTTVSEHNKLFHSSPTIFMWGNVHPFAPRI